MADLYKCLFSKYFILLPVWFNAGFLYDNVVIYFILNNFS